MNYTSRALENHIEDNMPRIRQAIRENGFYIAQNIPCDVEMVMHDIELKQMRGSELRRDVIATHPM